MKATGIVRRIDELGRVVIPKEIRRTLRLKSGEPLAVFTAGDEIMLKKYSPIASLEKFSEGTAKSLSDLSGHIAVICDTDGVLHASGRGQREFDGKNLSNNMEKIMRERKSYIASSVEGGDVVPICAGQQSEVTAQVIVPIVCNGDCLGAVALVSCERGAKIEPAACKLAQLSANILAGQFE